MMSMDGTSNKHHFGANSILSVSLAVAKAVAAAAHVELYQYLAYLHSGKVIKRKDVKFPTPVFNILNGGKHANNKLSFQEFMVIPAMTKSFDKQMEIGVNVYQALKKNLIKNGYDTAVGDEGGFAPDKFTVEKALKFIKNSAAEKYDVGSEVFLGMDVAAESFFDGENYNIAEQHVRLTSHDLLKFYESMIQKYDLVFLEDPYYENDLEGWQLASSKLGDKLLIVADDLVVTNPKYLKKAINQGLANAVIVKPNQVGTLTETLQFIKMAQQNHMTICVSHRSGDTAEDTFISDLALGVGAELIKSGSPVRGERVAKYNRLLEVFFS
jgi:enolase